MRVRQRKLYKKITLLKYDVGVQAALYAKRKGDFYMATKDTEPCAHKMVMQIPHSITPKYRRKVIYNQSQK